MREGEVREGVVEWVAVFARKSRGGNFRRFVVQSH